MIEVFGQMKNILANGIISTTHVYLFFSFMESTNVHIPPRSLLCVSRFFLFEHHDMSILTSGLHCVRSHSRERVKWRKGGFYSGSSWEFCMHQLVKAKRYLECELARLKFEFNCLGSN